MRTTLLVGLAAVLMPGAGYTQALAQPLPFFNQSPLIAIYGLPAAQGPDVLAAGTRQLAVSVDFSSDFVSHRNARESLVLDGETTRAALTYRQGFGFGLDASITLPFIAHSGGFADGFIDDFHSFTGFADGGRENGPRKRQLYRYARDGRTLLDVDDSPGGLGDIRLGLSRELTLDDSTQASLSAQLKLPTGDADKLTGSEATDVAVWATAGRADVLINGFSVVGAAGALYTGKGAILAGQRRRGAGLSWLTLGYAWTQRFVTKAQLYVHSPLYEHSRFAAINGVAVQGAAGLAWRFTSHTLFDFAIIEDLHAQASSDVSFNLSVRHGL